MIRFYFIVCLLFVCNTVSLPAQEPDPELIIDAVQTKFRQINDYEAQIKIKIDVDFIKIPVKYGTVWFLQPDKVEVKTKGFSLLPKRGMNFSPGYLFNGDFTSIYIKESTIDDHRVHNIKVIPRNEDDEIIIASLWIDAERLIVRKMEATTRNEGTFIMHFYYEASETQFDLPQSIVFQFDIRKNELPLGLTGDFETVNIKDTDSSKIRQGTVTINYLKYIVNEGKAVEVFRRKKKK